MMADVLRKEAPRRKEIEVNLAELRATMPMTKATYRTCLIGGTPSLRAVLEPKLMHYGLEVSCHYEGDRPPRDLPMGFDAYFVMVDVCRDANVKLPRWRKQAREQRLCLVTTYRKEMGWAQVLEQQGITKIGPVKAAALNDKEAGVEPAKEIKSMVIKVSERVEKAPKTNEERREELFAQLEAIVGELRRDHGLETLMIDNLGHIEAEVVRREKVSRG